MPPQVGDRGHQVNWRKLLPVREEFVGRLNRKTVTATTREFVTAEINRVIPSIQNVSWKTKRFSVHTVS